MDPDLAREISSSVNPYLEGTDMAITDLEPGFVQRLADGDAVAFEAVEDARWTIALSRAATAAQRIALGTRALERTLGVARAKDESWVDVTARFLKDTWVLDLTLGNEMFDAALTAYSGVPDRHTRSQTAHRDLHNLVLPERSPGQRFVDHAGLAVAYARYEQLWEEQALPRRVLREACSALTDPEAALAALARLDARFDRLLARTERQRNAVIHGTRPAAGVLATIDAFVTTLNALMAQESLRTAETGRPPLSHLEGRRARALRQRQNLKDGGRPVEILFCREPSQ